MYKTAYYLIQKSYFRRDSVFFHCSPSHTAQQYVAAYCKSPQHVLGPILILHKLHKVTTEEDTKD